jgi:hypothetical protein
MNRNLITAVLAVAMVSSGCASQQGWQGPREEGRDGGRGSCYAGEQRDDCRERLRVEQQSHRRYVWRDGRYEDQDAAGAAVAGAILGFVLGAAVAGSSSDRDYYQAHRNDRDWRNRCNGQPGFDQRSGTYLGQDGYRHYCTR